MVQDRSELQCKSELHTWGSDKSVDADADDGQLIILFHVLFRPVIISTTHDS